MSDDEIARLRGLGDPASRARLADLLVANGRAEEAVELCRAAVEQVPDDAGLQLALGRALSATGDLDEAQEVFFIAKALRDGAPREPADAASPPPPPPEATTPAVFPTPARRPVPPPRPSAPPVAAAPPAFPSLPEPPPATAPPPEHPAEPSPPELELPSRVERVREASPGPAAPAERYDLDAIAERLFEHDLPVPVVEAEPDSSGEDAAIARGFSRARRGLLLRLWLGALIVVGVAGASLLWRLRIDRLRYEERLADWKARSAEATFAGDRAAREAITEAAANRFHAPADLARAALAAARLSVDDGAPDDGAAPGFLRRAARDAATRGGALGDEADDARALLALGRGEPCPAPAHSPDVVARCGLRGGDAETFGKGLPPSDPANGVDVRALLLEADLAAGSGELARAAEIDRRVLVLRPDHPRALAGLALVGESLGGAARRALPAQPPPGIGPVAESWFRLALAAAARGRGDAANEAQQLDLVEAAAARDGLLAARLGLARVEQGRSSEAGRWLRVAARLSPGDPAVEILDAEVAIGRGLAEAVVARMASRTGPPRLLIARGRAELATGRPSLALASFDAAIAALAPGPAGSPDALGVSGASYRALARARLGASAAAEQELRALAAAHALPTTSRYALGRLAFERNDLAAARAELSLAMSGQPDAAAATELLGEVDRRLGRLGDAVTELESANRGDELIPSAAAALGRLYHALGRELEARRTLKRLVEAGHASPEDLVALAEATVAVAPVAEADERLAAAKVDPKRSPALAIRIQRARLILDGRRSPKAALAAARALEQLRRRAPTDSRLALDTALALRRSGDAAQAIARFRGLAGAEPLRANLLLGETLLDRGDGRGAQAAFRAALEAWRRGPFGPDARAAAQLGLGRALLAAKDLAGAQRALELACEQDQESPEPPYHLARVLRARGDEARAREEAERAAELDSRFVDAFRLVGELAEKKDPEAARVAFRRFLELAPGDPSAPEIRRRLGRLDGATRR